MKFFIVDGTEDCFYTAVFVAYREKECIITSEKNLQLDLESRLIDVESCAERAERVKKKIQQTDKGAIEDIMLVLRSQDKLKEQIAFEYIKLLMQYRKPVRNMTSNPHIMEMIDLRSKVTGELHNLKGFLRFIENEDGVLYAPYSPDNDITDLIAPHFAERFSCQKFVIHDIGRKIAALYDGQQIVMTSVGDAHIYLSEYERFFEDLWKQYYKSVNIAARPHEKQMKGYMPVRYWKYMIEKSDGN